MNTVTSLKTLNFLNGKWYGADRIRSLHFRVPFSTRLQERKPKSFFSIIVDHHDKGKNCVSLIFIFSSCYLILFLKIYFSRFK